MQNPPSAGATLQIYCWHGEGRFLFIASGGGTYDLVREQPVSSTTLETIRAWFQRFGGDGEGRRAWSSAATARQAPDENPYSLRELGSLVQRLFLHPDFRDLLSDDAFSDIVISTNEFSIPWELISCGDSFLGLRRPITRRLQSQLQLRSSARVLYRPTLRVLIVADPTGDLPATIAEADRIEALLGQRADRFDIRRLTSSECTRVDLLPLLAEADVFHYAGHAYFDQDRPKESGLLLHDGHLFASEIENFLDRRGPSLVFLNACQSSMFGRADMVVTGQTMAGLAHPFIAAGADAVIGAALTVPDLQAAEFATHVYTGLVGGASLAVSMWKARCALAGAHGADDPCWASFLLFGDGALRAVVDGRRTAPTAADVRGSIDQAIDWFERERADCGNWCDRVYRSEGAMNTAEVILAYEAAGRELPADALVASAKRLLAARAEGYSAAPYEPSALGVFTSSVAHVLLGLVALENRPDDTTADELTDAICHAGATLLQLQNADGGWSWGEAATPLVGAYTLFTIEALEALEAWLESGEPVSPTTKLSIERGYAFLERTQHADGGWSFRESVGRSDPTSTCYVVGKLLETGASPTSPGLARAFAYLKALVGTGELRPEQFFLDHRIEVPGVPQSKWPHFEDYGGLAGLLYVLTLAPTAESQLGTSGLFPAVLNQVLDLQEDDRGWPQMYSTIYATSYVLHVLGAAARRLSVDDGLAASGDHNRYA